MFGATICDLLSNEKTKLNTFLRLGLLLTDLSDANLKLAAQCGATDIVGPCPGFEEGSVQALVDRIGSFGLNLSVLERFVPHHLIVHDLPGRDEQVNNM